MNALSKSDFLGCKKHDGIAILGTGYSILNITPDIWQDIESKYDTFGMNWFCKSKHPTTWYLVREQANVPKRVHEGHTLDIFFDLMLNYKETCKIIKDQPHKAHNYPFSRNLDKFEGNGIVIKEAYGGCGTKSFGDDIFEIGLWHGKATMFDALHFAIYMNYNKILFCGIDLYDNRYFYLKANETLEQVRKEGRTYEDRHLLADKVVSIVRKTQDWWKRKMYVQNPQSLLTEVIPIWQGE
jgi:hypothetical protein